MMMRIARTIVALVTALSLAALPVAGAALASPKSAETAMSSEAAGSSDMIAAMGDCCPNQQEPCDQGSDHCQSMASCAHPSFSVSNASVSQIVEPLLRSGWVFLLAELAIPLKIGSTPFRPPRV
jgi:hypothetical protein